MSNACNHNHLHRMGPGNNYGCDNCAFGIFTDNPVNDPTPVEGVVLPQTSEGWKNLALRQAEELAAKDERFVSMENKHTEAYREAIADININQHIIDDALATIGVTKNERNEAIAQRDEAQRRLSSAIEAFGISEAALATARRDNAQLQYALEQSAAAYTAARAQGREEGLREAAKACHISTNLNAERTVLALISKK